MVRLQDAANGGGQLCFDHEMMRHDGKYVVHALKPPNPAAFLKEE